MLEGVPNMALAIGYINASWTLKCDLTCDYVCRLLNYMRDNALLSVCRATSRRHRDVRTRSRPDFRVHPTIGPSAAEARHRGPVEGAPELLARLPGFGMNDVDDSIMEFSGRRTQVKVLDPATP